MLADSSVALHRAWAMRIISADRSRPIALKLSCAQATSVEPLPQKGSRTRPPGGVTSRQSQRMSAMGLTVG